MIKQVFYHIKYGTGWTGLSPKNMEPVLIGTSSGTGKTIVFPLYLQRSAFLSRGTIFAVSKSGHGEPKSLPSHCQIFRGRVEDNVDATRVHQGPRVCLRKQHPPWTHSKQFSYSDFYFSSVVWVTSRSVAVTFLNRAQNISVVSKCSEPKFDCQEVSGFEVYDVHSSSLHVKHVIMSYDYILYCFRFI